MRLERSSSDRRKDIKKNVKDTKNKDHLRQLCKRLHLDPTKDYLSGKNIDNITSMNKELKINADKDYLKRQKEILDILQRNQNQDEYSKLEALSVQIRSKDYLIAGILNKTDSSYLDEEKQKLVGPNKERERLIRKFQNALRAYSDT